MKSLTASPSLGNLDSKVQEEEEGRREKGKKEKHGIRFIRKEEIISSREQEVKEIVEEENFEEVENEGNKRKENEVNVDGLERRCILGYSSLNKLLDSEDDIRKLEISEEHPDSVIEDIPNEMKSSKKNDVKKNKNGYLIRVTDEFQVDKTENENLIHTKNTGVTTAKEDEEHLIELNKLLEEGDTKKEKNEEEKEEDDKNTRDLWGDEDDEDI